MDIGGADSEGHKQTGGVTGGKGRAPPVMCRPYAFPHQIDKLMTILLMVITDFLA